MPLAPIQGTLGQPNRFTIQGGAKGPWPIQGNPSSVAAPSISYAGSPFQWYQYATNTTVAMVNTGGPITSVAVVAGSLPAGVTLNAASGLLTVAPTATKVAANVTIRATGPGGTSDAIINIDVWGPTRLGTKLKKHHRRGGTKWQDSARTTAATVATDPVGAWDDESADARHMIQATLGNKPTLVTDADVGLCLNCDGGDFLQEAAQVAPTVAQPLSIWLVMKFTGTPPAATEIVHDAWTATNIRVLRAITTGFLGMRSSTQRLSDDTDDGSAWHLYRFEFNGASSAIYRDGTLIDTLGGLSPGTNGWDGSFLGASAVGGALVLSGTRFAEFLITAGADAGEVTSLKAWVAASYAALTIA